MASKPTQVTKMDNSNHFVVNNDVEQLRADARRWQAVRDGSYELLHNLSTAPAQYREQIIDEVIKV